jgi:hypothetical protein
VTGGRPPSFSMHTTLRSPYYVMRLTPTLLTDFSHTANSLGIFEADTGITGKKFKIAFLRHSGESRNPVNSICYRRAGLRFPPE